MYDVILFGGTDEGHKIADFLAERDIKYIVCTATEYGASVLGNKNVRVGRMDAEEIKSFFEEMRPKIVVDATHPYAEAVTESIISACTCEYVRVARECVGGVVSGAVSVKSAREAARYLLGTSGNILITTGSKEIDVFAPLAERAYARVLPTVEALELCFDAGFEARRVICMQGPFSKELNAALMRELDIKYLVTKRGGESGGFREKTDAANEVGAKCVIIEPPPQKEGVSVAEAKKMILELLK